MNRYFFGVMVLCVCAMIAVAAPPHRKMFTCPAGAAYCGPAGEPWGLPGRCAGPADGVCATCELPYNPGYGFSQDLATKGYGFGVPVGTYAVTLVVVARSGDEGGAAAMFVRNLHVGYRVLDVSFPDAHVLHTDTGHSYVFQGVGTLTADTVNNPGFGASVVVGNSADEEATAMVDSVVIELTKVD